MPARHSLSPCVGMLTDCEVREFLTDNKLRKYDSLKKHVTRHTALVRRVDGAQTASAEADSEIDQAKLELDELERLSEVVWVHDRVLRHLKTAPSASQDEKAVEEFFAAAGEPWESEYTLEADKSLFAQGVRLLGRKIDRVRVDSAAFRAGVKRGQIIAVDGVEVKSGSDVMRRVEAASVQGGGAGKVSIRVRGELMRSELVNIANLRLVSLAALHATVADCDARMDEGQLGKLSQIISETLPAGPHVPAALPSRGSSGAAMDITPAA